LFSIRLNQLSVQGLKLHTTGQFSLIIISITCIYKYVKTQMCVCAQNATNEGARAASLAVITQHMMPNYNDIT